MPVYKREETSHKKNSVDEWNKANKPIIISDDKDKTTEYLCKYCNCVIKGKFTPDSIFCVHCQSEIYLDKDTRKALKSVKAHNTLDDTEPFVTSIQPNFEDMAGRTKWHRPVEYQGGFKALSQKGTIKITSYHEDISSSRQSQNQGRRTPGPIREGDDNKTE